MARKSKSERSSNWTILLTDDDADYAQTTRMLLEREGHQVVLAESGPVALHILREQHVDLLLLDYFMPGMTGEEVVTELRKFNQHVQVILQTGYASEQPPRELLKRLDIQGYHDKSEGPDKLLMWTDVGLKAAYTVQLLLKSRQGLRYILNVTPELHKIQPLDDLLQGIILQVAGLLGAANSFLAVIPHNAPKTPDADGFLAMVEDDAELIIHASTGRFSGSRRVADYLDNTALQQISRTLKQQEIQIIDTTTIVPLCVGRAVMGVVYLDRSVSLERDIELLQIFANQAAVAIQNSQLYEMATLDPLTGVYVRRFFEQWMLRELRGAFRSQQPISLLMMDMDKLKFINDTAGHPGGDRALAAMGKVLRQSLRDSDIAGRYGGDEFSVLLAQTSKEGSEHVAGRILAMLKDSSITGPDGDLPVTGSIGISILQPHGFHADTIPRPVPQSYFQDMLQALIESADQALYQAKKQGGARLCTATTLEWKALV